MGQIFLPGTPGSSVNRKKLFEADFKNTCCAIPKKKGSKVFLRAQAIKWWLRYQRCEAGTQTRSPGDPQITFPLFLHSFFLHLCGVWLFSRLQFTVLHYSEYPYCSLLWACHGSARATWQSSKPRHRTFFSVTFLLLFPLYLVLKRSKQQRVKNVGFFFSFNVAAFVVLNIFIQ